jgi:hypothetical protein
VTLILIILAIGVLNAAVAYDQEILILATHGWSFEAVIEALGYVILWPVQLAFWIGVKIWQAMDWCQAWIWR